MMFTNIPPRLTDCFEYIVCSRVTNEKHDTVIRGLPYVYEIVYIQELYRDIKFFIYPITQLRCFTDRAYVKP